MKAKKIFSTGAVIVLCLGIFRSVVDVFEDNYVTTMINLITGGDTLKITIYHIVKFGVCPIVAIGAGRWLKSHYLTVMRIGIVADLAFFLAFSQMQNSWVSIILTSAIQGSAFIMYYLPLNFIMANWIRSDELHKFFSYQSLIGKIMSVLLPVLLGGMIVTISYGRTISVMIVVVILQLATLLFANKADAKPQVYSSYNIISFIKKAFSNKEMSHFFIISFCKGAVLVGAQSQLINLLIIAKFGDELQLGKVTSIVAVIAMVTLYVFGKFANEKMYRKILSVLTVIQVTVVVSLLLWTNTATIILIKLCFDCVLSIVGLITNAYVFKLADNELTKSHKAEYFVFHEIGMNAGRIVSWLFVIIATTISVNILPLAILLITIIFLVMVTILRIKS